MYRKILDEIKSKKNVAILGFGKEGISTYKFIRKYLNISLTIIDRHDVSRNENLINDKNIIFVHGDTYLEDLDKYDLIFKTPGISFKNLNKEILKNKITSQMEMLLKYYSTQVIAITGTKGKSTTTSLIYEIIKQQNSNVYLLGNIGIPILDYVTNFDEKSYLVVEASSHQLEFVNHSPHIGIILNLFEDHLDHAGTLENYHNSKLNIFKHQNTQDYLIYYRDDEVLTNYLKINKYKAIKKYIRTKTKCNNAYYIKEDFVYHKENIYNINDTRNLIGDHNLINIMFALVVVDILSLDRSKAIETINKFKPLEHRLELVGKYDGIYFYNDAISTIPGATINGIKALKTVDTLIFGGMDRGINYQELIDFLNKGHVKKLIAMPSTGHKIVDQLDNKNIFIIKVEDLKEAVMQAKKITEKNKICLMSPAASSYEYFKNFEEKGTKYKEYIKN